MLVNPLTSTYRKPNFKRNPNNLLDKLYYFIIGTILLIIINIKIIWKLFFIKKDTGNNSTNTMKNIHCGAIKLDQIKNITTKYNVTVNTFLYALMIKTWYNYNETSTDNVMSISTININNNPSSIYNTNNIFFVFSETSKCNDNAILLKKIDDLFNLYKFSPFISITNKLLSYLLPYISEDFQSHRCNDLFCNVNLSFSNIIGPTIKNANFTNIQFSTVTKNNEICFNMISYNDEININVSFRKNLIKHKPLFISCFQRAYNSLIATITSTAQSSPPI
jgi:hypothetical protein